MPRILTLLGGKESFVMDILIQLCNTPISTIYTAGKVPNAFLVASWWSRAETERKERKMRSGREAGAKDHFRQPGYAADLLSFPFHGLQT